MPKTAFIASTSTHTFIIELARAGSTKLVASSFPIASREADSLVPLRSVPPHIRRAARQHLLG